MPCPVTPEQPGHYSDHHQLEHDADHLGHCVASRETLQMEGVIDRVRYGVHSSRNDRDGAQQPLAGRRGRHEQHRQGEAEFTDVAGWLPE